FRYRAAHPAAGIRRLPVRAIRPHCPYPGQWGRALGITVPGSLCAFPGLLRAPEAAYPSEGLHTQRERYVECVRDEIPGPSVRGSDVRCHRCHGSACRGRSILYWPRARTPAAATPVRAPVALAGALAATARCGIFPCERELLRSPWACLLWLTCERRARA